MTSIKEMQSGEFLGVSVIEISSIPLAKILPKDPKDSIENHYKRDFARLLSEIHHQAFQTLSGENEIGDAALEITWVTSPVSNQLYSANISMYILGRIIGPSKEYTKRLITSMVSSVRTLLLNQKYDFKEIDYEEYLERTDKKFESCCALLKHERVELTSVPNVPIAYSYECIPESDMDLSDLTGALAFSPNTIVRIQAIPTLFNVAEIQHINSFVQSASFASKGIMTREGSVSFSQIDRPLKTYKYYEGQSNGSLFLYNILIQGPSDSIGSLTSQICGQINSNPSTPIRFDEMPLPNSIFMKDEVLFLPWVVQDLYKQHLLNTELAIDRWRMDNNLRRLSLIVSAVELSEIFRLPIGSEIVRSGLKINESKNDITVYRDDLINSGDLLIGHLKTSIRNMIGVSLTDLTKHMFISGTPGSGKSSFSIGVLDRLWNDHHIPFIVIEPAKTEYRSLVKRIPELQVFTPGKEYISPFVFNPFMPPKNVKLRSYKSTLKTAFGAAVSMSTPLDKIFEESINNCYSEHRWLDSYTVQDGGDIFDITEFIKTFKETSEAIGYVGDSSNIGRAGVVRLNSLVNLFDNYHSIPIEDLLTKPTVIELAAIENAEQKSLMISLILLSILSYVNANYEGDGRLKNVILLEEAHVLLDQEINVDKDSNPGPLAQSLVKRMLAEARSYGLGMMIADQSPRKVGLDIVALTDIKVIFRIVEGTDKQIIGDSMAMDEVQLSRLSKLRPGGAFLFFNKLDNPEEIAIDDYRAMVQIPVWISDEEITDLSTYWNDKQRDLRPYPECDIPVFCKESCNLSRRLMAKDIGNRIFKKYIGKTKDIDVIKKAASQLQSLVKKELNGEPFTPELFYCIKVHFWRNVRYNSNFKTSSRTINALISR